MKDGVLDILIYLFENYFDGELDEGDEPDRDTLRALQARYIAQSTRVDLQAWRQRPPGIRLLEGAAGLLSPLL